MSVSVRGSVVGVRFRRSGRGEDGAAHAGLPVIGLFAVPNSVDGIADLVGRIQIESQARRAKHEYERVYVFHNRPRAGALYEPIGQRLLPLDAECQRTLTQVPWPTAALLDVMAPRAETLRALLASSRHARRS